MLSANLLYWSIGDKVFLSVVKHAWSAGLWIICAQLGGATNGRCDGRFANSCDVFFFLSFVPFANFLCFKYIRYRQEKIILNNCQLAVRTTAWWVHFILSCCWLFVWNKRELFMDCIQSMIVWISLCICRVMLVNLIHRIASPSCSSCSSSWASSSCSLLLFLNVLSIEEGFPKDS